MATGRESGGAHPTDETATDDDWQRKYQSLFTYAAYNDLDKMGYRAPKRYGNQHGPRYSRYSYTPSASVLRTVGESRALHTVVVEAILIGLSFCLLLLTLPLSLAFSLKFIGEFEKLVVLRLGRAQKTRGPGATLVLPCIDTYKKVDLRVNAFNVPPMQIITIDHGLVELGATVFLRVNDALAAVCTVKERNCATRTLAVATLHRLVCKQCVIDVTSSNGRRKISELLQGDLAELTLEWGIEITKVEISEIKVIKEGENMALKAFNRVLKSDFGTRILQTITNTAHEFVLEQRQLIETEKDLIELNTIDATANGDRCQPSPPPPPPSQAAATTVAATTTTSAAAAAAAMVADVDQLLCSLSMVIDECLVSAIGQIYQVNCDGLGNFYIDLKNGAGSCAKGTCASPDIIFGLEKRVLAEIIRKQITPMQAYFTGALQICGPIKAAIKLTVLTDRLSCLL